MYGFESYQVSAWQENGLLRAIDSVTDDLVQKTRDQSKKFAKKISTIGKSLKDSINVADFITEIFLDSRDSVKSNVSFTHYVSAEELTANQKLRLNFEFLKNYPLDENLVKPTKFSIAVVEWLLDKFPNFKGKGEMGLDYDGEIYFKFTHNNQTGYLSIEDGGLMHFLYLDSQKKKTRLDGIYFKKGTIPAVILKELNKF
ncbi:hypothetical protein ABTK95_04850 [Acinetobacter baumannii]|nr:hypothetical protein [Acinetobacter baumannii]